RAGGSALGRGGDAVGDGGDAGGRLARLAAYEQRLVACAADPAAVDDPVFLALGHTIATHGLPLEPFRDLLTAFRRDAAGETRTMATFADVLEYCRCSANPVGRIVLGLFGHRDPERQARSDEICPAWQLTTFGQDGAGDLERGRVYLPQEDLDRFAGSRDALAGRRLTPGFAALMAFEVGRARSWFAR